MVSANAPAEIGGHLRAIRKSAGLSQQRVAELAGCSVSYVRLIESGYRPESRSAVLSRIADVLTNKSPVAATPGSCEISGEGVAGHASSG